MTSRTNPWLILVLGGLTAAPSPAEQASALVDGFHIAFAGGAAFMAAGAILLMLMLRRSDVRHADVEGPVELDVAA